jgi:hypothetical protein
LVFCSFFGAVAQLGEHLVCNQGVAGSIPVRSTWYINALQWFSLLGFFLSSKSVVSDRRSTKHVMRELGIYPAKGNKAEQTGRWS